MDVVETIVSSVVARRALLFEQFLVEHSECYPGIDYKLQRTELLTRQGKCSCGAQLEATILVKLVSHGYQPK